MGPKSNRKSTGRDVAPSSSSAAPSSAQSATCSGDDMMTLTSIDSSSLTQLARDMWAGETDKINQLDQSLISKVYSQEVVHCDNDRVHLLVMSGYLELYLLRHVHSTMSMEHVLSVVTLINEKATHSYTVFHDILQRMSVPDECFGLIVDQSVDLLLASFSTLPVTMQVELIRFFSLCIHSLEILSIRSHVLRLLSFPLCAEMSDSCRHRIFFDNTDLSTAWEKYQTSWKSLHENAAIAPSKSSAGGRKRSAKQSLDDDVAEKTAQLRAMNRDRFFVVEVLKQMLLLLDNLSLLQDSIPLLENMFDFLLSILGQVPTRRFVTSMLADFQLIIRLRHSEVVQHLLAHDPKNNLLRLFDFLSKAMRVPLNDMTGRLRTRAEVMDETQSRFAMLQQTSFALYSDRLRDIVFGTVASVTNSVHSLRQCFALISDSELMELAVKLDVVSRKILDEPKSLFRNREILIEVFLTWLSPSCSFDEDFVRDVPLFPTESTLWDEETVMLSKHVSSSNKKVFALPKLNLQFLSVHDYLTRNFELFRLESSFAIRQNVEEAVQRMNPTPAVAAQPEQMMATQLTVYSALNSKSLANSMKPKKPQVWTGVSFAGQSRFGIRIQSSSVGDVISPSIGERTPRRVSLFVNIDVSSFQGEKRKEWESIKEHDVVFLVCIKNPLREEERSGSSASFCSKYGVQYVRGATVTQVRDEADVVLNDSSVPDERPLGRVGGLRKLRLSLDPAQYLIDMDNDSSDVYESFNLLVRRDSRENNFKAVLETIRDVACSVNIGRAIPDWLTDVFLGYGDVSAMTRKRAEEEIDFADTFLDVEHIVECFPNAKKLCLQIGEGVSDIDRHSPSCLLPSGSLVKLKFSYSFPTPGNRGAKSLKRSAESQSAEQLESLTVVPYFPVPSGPYPEDKRQRNSVRFTRAQCSAIHESLRNGLSLVVGPPGTGKTDVAVQIVSNLYQAFPQQRILIVTHSNAALNDIFEKIMNKGVDPRHCLRLGSGEAELRELLSGSTAATSNVNTEKIFSKTGRVNACLIRRLTLLAQVQRLSQSLSLLGDSGTSCETAELFFQSQVSPRIKKFDSVTSQSTCSATDITAAFPFHSFFSDAPQPLFTEDLEAVKASAQGCVNHILNMFEELRDYRALELLRTQNLRCDYLLTNQAKIVAMTCTHAAIMRRRLVELGFKFDSIIMEESGQILEVETLIPILAQDADSADKGSRLKRVTLIGDHLQLPPIVQHPVLKAFCRFEQSMFTRFVRLGVPYTLLDKQGRSRHEIADLYRYRYASMGSSASTTLSDLVVPGSTGSPFMNANSGFVHTMQFIDVGELNGKGETCPTAHFYQNQAEAEYVVAVYQFMRLLGYPAEKISLLTSYNGQKSLLKEIVQTRCCGPKNNAFFGRPGHIMTVDEFQGRQNDFVLLSLVRTQSVGHIRDVRRLTVALSRARLGLYIFGREQLFRSAAELQQALRPLFTRSTKLSLIAGESFPCSRSVSEEVDASRALAVEDVTSMGILVYQMVQQAQYLEQQKTASTTQ